MDRYELFSFSCCLIAVTILVIFARRIGLFLRELWRCATNWYGLACAVHEDEEEAEEKELREADEWRMASGSKIKFVGKGGPYGSLGPDHEFSWIDADYGDDEREADEKWRRERGERR